MSYPTNDETIICDSAKIQFIVNKYDLNFSLGQNQQVLDQITNRLQNTYTDSIYQIEKIVFIGAASPEGSIPLNKMLSEYRNKSVTTVEEAKKIIVEVDTKKQSQTTTTKAAAKRDYSKKELDSLFDNIFEVEL